MTANSGLAKYSIGEKVLCFHGPLLYEAKILDVKLENNEYAYFVHYQGWNKNWDEWATDARMFKYDEAGLRKQKDLQKLAKSGKKLKVLRKSDLKKQPYPPPEVIEHIDRTPLSSDEASEGGPETPRLLTVLEDQGQGDTNGADSHKLHSSIKSEEPSKVQPPSSRKRRGRGTVSTAGEREEGTATRARINIVLPDNLRAWLVDDWDLTTKQSRICSVPARKPISHILDEYLEQVKTTTPVAGDSKEMIITHEMRQEFVAGLRVNFNFIIGSQLLYNCEQLQYAELVKKHDGQEMVELYGPAHLLRLLVKLRDLITFASTNNRSVALLEAMSADFVRFLDKNLAEYFQLEDYNVAPTDYFRPPIC